MWWIILLDLLVLFLWPGIPLILEMRAEKKEQQILLKEKQNKTIKINEGVKLMKNGEFIYAKTNADFLNKAFGTNYNKYMKGTWGFNSEWTVWMVRFNEVRRGWRNSFLPGNRIMEENLAHHTTWDGQDIRTEIHKKKIVIQIIDGDFARKYIFRGKYEYDEKNSDPYSARYYNKVSDEM